MTSDSDRLSEKIDDAIAEIIGEETKAAWAKVSGGMEVAAAVKQFASGLPRLLALRDALRSRVANVVGGDFSDQHQPE